MIYIFDDREERRENYSSLFINYKSQLTQESFTPEGDLQEYVTDKFGDAEIVIMHRSYRFPGDNYELSDVLNAFKGVPIVLFSGAIQKASILKAENIYQVNSIVMYENLSDFLDSKKVDNNAPIEMILWGKNFIKNQFLTLLGEINKLCVETDFDDFIDPYIAIELVEDKLRFSTLRTAQNELINMIEGKEENLTYAELIEAIQTIMHR